MSFVSRVYCGLLCVFPLGNSNPKIGNFTLDPQGWPGRPWQAQPLKQSWSTCTISKVDIFYNQSEYHNLTYVKVFSQMIYASVIWPFCWNADMSCQISVCRGKWWLRGGGSLSGWWATFPGVPKLDPFRGGGSSHQSSSHQSWSKTSKGSKMKFSTS